jgi:hypothetical protein
VERALVGKLNMNVCKLDIFSKMFLTFCLLFISWGVYMSPHSVYSAAKPSSTVGELEREFVEAWNTFIREAIALSPVSFDYSQRVVEAWSRAEVGEKFRKFERRIQAEARKK